MCKKRLNEEHVTCERKRKNEMNDDNSSLSPATRDTRVICGWVGDTDRHYYIIFSSRISVACLLHGWFRLKLTISFNRNPAIPVVASISNSIWSSFNLSVPQNNFCWFLFFDSRKWDQKFGAPPNPIFNMFWFFETHWFWPFMKIETIVCGLFSVLLFFRRTQMWKKTIKIRSQSISVEGFLWSSSLLSESKNISMGIEQITSKYCMIFLICFCVCNVNRIMRLS